MDDFKNKGRVITEVGPRILTEQQGPVLIEDTLVFDEQNITLRGVTTGEVRATTSGALRKLANGINP